MKKLVLAMACVLSLALLASCKQEAATDIAVNNQEFTTAGAFKGKVVLTADAGSYSGATWTSTTSTTDGFLVSPYFATISWKENADNVDSNYKAFSLTFEADYASDVTSTTYSPTYVSKTIDFVKVGDDYYYETEVGTANGLRAVNKKLTLEDGDPATGSFTLKDFGLITIDSQTANLSKVVFTVAE